MRILISTLFFLARAQEIRKGITFPLFSRSIFVSGDKFVCAGRKIVRDKEKRNGVGKRFAHAKQLTRSHRTG